MAGGSSATVGRLLAILCIIAVIISGFNTYLVFNSVRIQQKQLGELQDSLDEVRSSVEGRISELESALSALTGKMHSLSRSLSEKVHSLNRTVSTSITELRSNVRELWADIRVLRSSLDNLMLEVKTLYSDLGEIVFDVEKLYSILDGLAFNISRLEKKMYALLGRTPADIYKMAYKSVVVVRTDLGLGSGFLYHSTNIILTNWHVVANASAIEVEFYDGTRRRASTVGVDPYSDIAVLMVPSSPPDVEPLKLGNSSRLYIGQQVVAIGNPLGLEGSLSVGYISQINRIIELPPLVVPVLQLDITIAPGNSGGPLLDLNGTVMGITNAGMFYKGVPVGFNFAIPSNIMRRVADSIIERGYYLHPFIGVQIVELNPETIRSMNILNVDIFQTGLLILGVLPGYPAEKAGLRPAVKTQAPDGSPAYIAMDIILAVNGHPTPTLERFTAYFEEHVSPNQLITLTLWRSGRIEAVQLITTYRPPYEG